MFLRCYKTIQWFYDENVKSATVVVDQINLNVTVTSISKTMYVCQSGSINVRDSWTTSSTKVGELSYNASVTVTGITTTTSDGHQWYRIKYIRASPPTSAPTCSPTKKDSTVTRAAAPEMAAAPSPAPARRARLRISRCASSATAMSGAARVRRPALTAPASCTMS